MHSLRSTAALLALLLSACGGIAVLGPEGGGGGTGGNPSTECVGACGSPCTKCVGDSCFNGACSEEGECLPPDQPLTCPG
jgi:hypothetical protein